MVLYEPKLNQRGETVTLLSSSSIFPLVNSPKGRGQVAAAMQLERELQVDLNLFGVLVLRAAGGLRYSRPAISNR